MKEDKSANKKIRRVIEGKNTKYFKISAPMLAVAWPPTLFLVPSTIASGKIG
jgi:hypothetical protein